MSGWIFMLFFNLIIPITMIGVGSYFYKHAPKEINHVYGYRTSMSMKNKDTWEFAHHYCGKVWKSAGWVVLVLSIISSVLVIGKEVDIQGKVGGLTTAVQIIVLVCSIFPTEIALKKNFDKNGNRKKELE